MRDGSSVSSREGRSALSQHEQELLKVVVQSLSDEKRAPAGLGFLASTVSRHQTENYHSDLLAFLLRFESVRSVFVRWIAERAGLNPEEVWSHYRSGNIERETDRVDVYLRSGDRIRAIIVENKSNDAADQQRQLHRYREKAQAQNVHVDAMVYLNRYLEKLPDLGDIELQRRREILGLLVSIDLRGLIKNVLEPAAGETSDPRLRVILHEVADLFWAVSGGGMSMDGMNEFYEQLSDPRILELVAEVHSAYDRVPAFLARTYFDLLKSWGLRTNIPSAPNYLQADLWLEPYKSSLVFHLDFAHHGVDLSVTIRSGKEELLDDLRGRLAHRFPFETMVEGRYRVLLDHPLDRRRLEQSIRRYVEPFSELAESLNR